MNEIISGMKIIKLYTWEESFAKVIESLRGSVLDLSFSGEFMG